MGIDIRPSDLYYRYARKKTTRDQPKFSGIPDPTSFDVDDLYDVLPMLEAVMDTLDCRDGAVLETLEEIMVKQMPDFITTREEVFHFLLGMLRERLERC